MMVIDAGTIQTPQTLQQIKRLFCKVVKEHNGGGEAMSTPSPALLSYHQLLFGFLGVIPREVSYYKPFMLTRTGYTADAPCAHMEVCMSIWQEVYITTPWNYGFILFYSKSLFIFSMLHQLCNFWYYILCSPVKHSVTWFFKGSNEIKIAWELLPYYGSLEETPTDACCEYFFTWKWKQHCC